MDSSTIASLAGCTDQLVLHLFGGPYITMANTRRDVPEGSKRLLAYVALHRTRIERRLAAGALWPRGNDGRAAGNLRSALWRLRCAGIDVLAADKWSVRLTEDVLVDVHLLEEWATRVIKGAERRDDLTALPIWIDTLDLLPGWYDDWALVERERLRQRMLHALDALTSRLIQAGRFADAVDTAVRAVHAEPLRETAQQALIEAHIAEGNVSEARRAYSRYREMVQVELGIEPSEKLLALISGTPQDQRSPVEF
jgi:DNA-binding SARP family transcriptional activator